MNHLGEWFPVFYAFTGSLHADLGSKCITELGILDKKDRLNQIQSFQRNRDGE